MLVSTITNKSAKNKPVWLMRQAGRHLSEYRALRKKYESFIDFCLKESSIYEVTLLPIRRYNIDAAILFSDILLVPWALGQKLQYIKNFGPKLEPITKNLNLLEQDFDITKFITISNAIKKIKANLVDKDLIGFSGAPWTIACYMLEGQGSRSFEKTRKYLWENPKRFEKIIDKLVYCVCDFLELQANAGVDLLMIFDTWSQMIPSYFWDKFSIKPTQQIIQELRKRKVSCPIIGFPFKAGEKLIKYSYESEVDVVSIDWNTDLNWVCKNINSKVITQGNIDPILLTTTNKSLIRETVNKMKDIVTNKAHIYNVGHGLTPECVPENIDYLIKRLKEEK